MENLTEAQKRSLIEDKAKAVKLMDQILALTEQYNELCKDADETYPLTKGVFKEHTTSISKGKLTELLDKQGSKLESHELMKSL